MKKIKSILIITFFSIMISACGAVKEGFKNQKKDNTDEFLVEKKAPLVMPPNYNELPLPKDIEINEEEESDAVKELITKSKNSESNNKNLDKSEGSLENNILNKIKK
tara:strand:+ start:238 stop:558 length:321 start_codon:yes stop_codon:yes gene_type:complete